MADVVAYLNIRFMAMLDAPASAPKARMPIVGTNHNGVSLAFGSTSLQLPVDSNAHGP